MRNLIITICLAALIGSLVPIPSALAEVVPVSGEVKVTADSVTFDQSNDHIQARGGVKVLWDNYTLLSDSVLVRKRENEAVAEGNVRLLKEGNILTSNRIRINYQSELGEADNGWLFIKQRNFYLSGDHFLKTGDSEYRLERGAFTTCDGDSPSWKFTADELDVSVEDYATGKNALFYIGKVPVFYTPYVLFPIMRERQTGFLIPRIGTSSKKGFYLDVPFYWAISQSQDVTFDIDGQTKRGVGTGVSYRYIRPRGSDGLMNGYLIYDSELAQERGYVTLKGHEFFSPSFSLTSDVNLTLDRNFYRDYAENSGDYNRQLLDSTVYLTENMSLGSLSIEGRYIDNLDAPNNESTIQKLPVVSFTRGRTPIGTTPVYLGIDSSFINFYRDVGSKGERIDVHPVLAYYYKAPPGIDISLWGGYRQRWYSATGGDSGNGSFNDGMFDAGAVVSSSLARVYPVEHGDLRAVRHTVIPEAGYNFVQEKDQGRLPFFDWNDRPVGQGMATWSFTNYLTGKYLDPAGTPFYRDLLFLKLSQGYQAGGSRRDLLTLVDDMRRFTDIRIEGRFSPTKLVTLTTDSRYNPSQIRFSTAAVGLDLSDGDGNLAGANYQFARGQVQYMQGKATLSLAKPFVFNYNLRYSFDKGGFLESLYSVEYKRQCWSVTFSYRDRQDDREFLVNFTLAGIGSLGPMRAY
jgi:LPS-assembly protein